MSCATWPSRFTHSCYNYATAQQVSKMHAHIQLNALVHVCMKERAGVSTACHRGWLDYCGDQDVKGVSQRGGGCV